MNAYPCATLCRLLLEQRFIFADSAAQLQQYAREAGSKEACSPHTKCQGGSIREDISTHKPGGAVSQWRSKQLSGFYDNDITSVAKTKEFV